MKQIHQARIDVEEMKSSKPSSAPKDLAFREAVVDPDTRAIYIRRRFIFVLFPSIIC